MLATSAEHGLVEYVQPVLLDLVHDAIALVEHQVAQSLETEAAGLLDVIDQATRCGNDDVDVTSVAAACVVVVVIVVVTSAAEESLLFVKGGLVGEESDA